VTKPTKTTTDGAPVGLRRALIAAQRDLKAVHKGSENAFHRYRYASAEDMITACRQALHANGLSARRVRWTTESSETHFWLVSSYELAHESGEVEHYPMATKWPFAEEKGRPLDKALSGAATSSLGYWLRDLLLVPRDDEEMDKRDDRAHDPEVLGIARAGRLRAQATKAGVTIAQLRERLAVDGLTLGEDPVSWPAAAAARIAAALTTSA
jgi:hypothetical protein